MDLSNKTEKFPQDNIEREGVKNKQGSLNLERFEMGVIETSLTPREGLIEEFKKALDKIENKVESLEGEIRKSNQQLSKNIDDVRKELSISINETRKELSSNINEIRKELSNNTIETRKELSNDIGKVRNLVIWFSGGLILALFAAVIRLLEK